MSEKPDPRLLEQFLVDDWADCPHDLLRGMAESYKADGVPVGIAHYNNGWYLLVTDTEGPTIVASTRMDNPDMVELEPNSTH